ncbi:MAG: hypothetical protein J6I85_01680 [Clostridia bacterium]|nr:hypothetical protein [Clostridia bacterium]
MKEETCSKKSMKIFIIIEIIIAVLIIIGLIFVIVLTNKSNDNSLNDFEKIGVYNYLEKGLIDYNLFGNLKDNELKRTEKSKVILEDYYNRNNTNTMKEEEFIKNYNNLFEKDEEIITIIPQLENYEYNMEDRTIVKINSDYDEEEYQFTYKIDKISKENDMYKVEFNVFYQSEIGETFIEENVGKANLTIKVENGKYIIINFYRDFEIHND